jgi:hypothetical protein
MFSVKRRGLSVTLSGVKTGLVLVGVLLLVGCGSGDKDESLPATYEEAINELVCFNPGTTFEEMDREARAFAAQKNLSIDEVARKSVMEARENVSVDGAFGVPCR